LAKFIAGSLIRGNIQNAVLQAPGQPPLSIQYERQVWHPAPELAADLPPGFAIPLACWTDQNGLRRWLPEDSLIRKRSPDEVIGQMFLGGLEILRRVKDLNHDAVASYLLMFHLFSRRGFLSECYTQKFAWSSDLYIPPGGRVFGDTLGFPKCGIEEDRRLDRQMANDARTVLSVVKPGLSVRRFFANARNVAKGRGLPNPSRAKLIQLGLLQLAQKARPEDKLPLTKASSVVRNALFDLDMKDAEVDKILDEPFVQRLLKAIESHLADPADKYNSWLVDEMIHKSFARLARQKRAPSGPMDPQNARKIVVALLWRAYTYVGDCVCCQMRVIENSIQPTLSADEATLFERTYLRQDVFAGLPWLLLRERWDVLAPEIYEWMDDPKRQLDHGVVLRLLQMYGAMVSARRQADRKSKKTSIQGGRQFTYDDERDAAQATTDKSLEQSRLTVHAIVEADGVTCQRCRGTRLKLTDHEVVGEEISLEFSCQDCEGTVTHRCTVAWLCKVMGGFFDDAGPAPARPTPTRGISITAQLQG
jgi:hypothetical protein